MIGKPLFAALMALLLLPAFSYTPLAYAESDRTRIHPSADQVQPLLPGLKVPAFKMRDAAGNSVSFDPASVARPIILTFFRGGWCPYCNMYLSEMRHAEAQLKTLGFDLWFVSVDRPEILYASLEDPDIGYTVYSDARLEASRAFGVAFQIDEATVEQYRGYGIDLEAASGEKHHALPAPSTFLIGTDGVVHFQYTNPDYTVRLHPDVLLAAAKTYQADADSRLNRAMKSKQGK